MKNKRSFMFVSGMLALIFGIMVLACDNGSTETTADAISLGETFTQNHTATGGSGTFSYYRGFGGDLNYPLTNMSAGSISVAADGAFTLSLSTPSASLLENEIFSDSGVTVSPGDTKGHGISYFVTVGTSGTGKMLSLKNGTKKVAYLYVNKDATVSGEGLPNAINLKKGWNLVISSEDKAYTGPVDDFSWVIENYAGK